MEERHDHDRPTHRRLMPVGLTVCRVDYSGDAHTSTSPTGDAGAWSTFTIDAGPCPIRCHSIKKGPPERQLSALSCPSVSLCVAGDWDGDVVTSTDPTGGSGAWTAAYVDTDQEGAHDGAVQAIIGNISCVSAALCAASDGTGGVVTSSDPTRGASAWRLSRAAPVTDGQGGGGFWSLSCPSAWLCASLYRSSWSAPSEVALTRHLRRGGEWERGAADHLGELSAISCPSELLCLAGATNGSIVVGRATPARRPGSTTPPDGAAATRKGGAYWRHAQSRRVRPLPEPS